MMVYLIKTCEVKRFKKLAKLNVKVQEIGLFTKTCDVYILKNRNEAIKDCRRYNKIYEKYSVIYYFTEIKLH